MSAQQFFAWAGGPASSWLGLGLRLVVGLALSAGVGWAGFKRASLSRSGLLGAMLVGTLTFGLGGWVWGLLLVAFFATSSALTHYASARKQPLADHFAKGSRRDLAQVLANGGLGAALAMAYAATGGQPTLFFAFAGAMAAVTADTWATELGVLSADRPRLITTGEAVEPGTSGAVSPLGSLAAMSGAWMIGFLSLALQLLQGRLSGVPWNPRLGWLPLLAALAGLAGSLFDSLLGATLQASYYCMHCGKETEQPIHRCGRQPIHIRGWPWLDNDGVNLLASLAGALIAGGLGVLALHV